MGPDELLIAAKIAVHHDDTAADVARGIDAAEARVRAQFPEAKMIYLEPALSEPAAVPAPAQAPENAEPENAEPESTETGKA